MQRLNRSHHGWEQARDSSYTLSHARMQRDQGRRRQVSAHSQRICRSPIHSQPSVETVNLEVPHTIPNKNLCGERPQIHLLKGQPRHLSKDIQLGQQHLITRSMIIDYLRHHLELSLLGVSNHPRFAGCLLVSLLTSEQYSHRSFKPI